MISGFIAGFLTALVIFFFENIIGLSGDALIPLRYPLKTPLIITKKIAGKITVTKITTTVIGTHAIMNELPEFFTWIMLFTIHTGAAVALGLAAYQKLRKNFNTSQIDQKEVVISLILVLLMMIISSTSYIVPFNSGGYYHWPAIPLNHMWPKIILLLAISISAAGVSVLGLILSGCACMKLVREEFQENIIERYFELKEAMECFLMITGYILSSGMITVYFFMATEKDLNMAKYFDIHGLTLFGLMFTVFIATTFIPCKLLLSDLGRAIIIKQMGAMPATTAELKTWIETSEGMEKYLQLKFDAVETIKYAIPVLAPILSSFLPGIFKS
ncbi:hypothetical protein ACFJIV_05660 [Mucilaginibacter sp. UC70_90]